MHAILKHICSNLSSLGQISSKILQANHIRTLKALTFTVSDLKKETVGAVQIRDTRAVWKHYGSRYFLANSGNFAKIVWSLLRVNGKEGLG